MSTKSLAWLFYIFFGALITASVGVILLVQYVDWNAYRATLSDLASDQMQLSVELDGPVSASLFPRPGFQIADVTVRPKEGEGDLVTRADLISVRVSLPDLMAGRITIASLALQGAELTLAEQESGAWVIEGWAPDSDRSSGTVHLNALELSRSKLTLIPLVGDPLLVADIDATLSGTLPGGQFTWDAAATVAGEPLTVTGRYRPSDDTDGFAFMLNSQVGTGEWRISGRSGVSTPFIGRIELVGPDLVNDASAIAAIAGLKGRITGPKADYDLDIQVTENAGVMELDGRALRVGTSAGQFSASVALKDGEAPTVTGQMAMTMVDLVSLMAFAVEAEDGDSGSAAAFPLRGSFDLRAETIETDLGLMQQASASLVFTPGALSIGQAQALMPGGSELVLSGELATAPAIDFKGHITVASRNLNDLLDGTDLMPKEGLTLGRLSTADLVADIAVGDGVWTVSDLSGKVDTIALEGSFSGRIGDVAPLTANLNLHSLNLDALLPASTPQGAGSEASEPWSDQLRTLISPLSAAGTTIRLGIQELVWQGKALTDIDLSGRVGQSGLVLDALSLKDRSATISLSGRLDLAGNGAWRSDLTAEVARLGFDRLRPRIKHIQIIEDILGRSVNASLRLNGPLEETLISGRLGGPGGTVRLDGTFDMQDPVAGRQDLQFQTELLDVRPFFSAVDMSLKGASPARLTASLERTAANRSAAFTLGGSLFDGQVTLEGILNQDQSVSGTVGFKHRDGAAFASQFADNPIPVEHLAGALSVNSQLTQTEQLTRLDRMTVSLDQAVLTGNLTYSAAQGLAGSITLADAKIPLNWSQGGRAGARAIQSSPSTPATSYPDIDLQIALENVEVGGQAITAPKARLIAQTGQATFDVGPLARLQDGPFEGGGRVSFAGKQDWQFRLQADRLSTHQLLSSLGYPALMTGPARVTLTLSGAGFEPKKAASSLTGEMAFSLSGGSLAFLDAPALALSVTQAPSIRSFLSGLGKTARSGESPLRGLTIASRLVDGVVLVDTFEGQGAWGGLSLGGQVNLAEDRLDITGALDLLNPAGAPPIELTYTGSLYQPQGGLGSKLFEQFAFRQITRRLQSSESRRQANSSEQKVTPGEALFGVFSNTLQSLREREQESEQPSEGN